MAKAKHNGNDPNSDIIVIKCPAGHHHYIHTKSKNGQGCAWSFNGDMEKPTFSPSINERTGWFVDPSLKNDPKADQEWLSENSYHCHFFVREGNIIFCGDCSHDLKGKTMPLPDIE